MFEGHVLPLLVHSSDVVPMLDNGTAADKEPLSFEPGKDLERTIHLFFQIYLIY